MNEEQYQKYLASMKVAIQEAVGPAIETNVNGKIRSLTLKMDEYIKDDNDWKAKAQPTIDLGNDMRGFGKVFGYLTAGVAGLYGLIKLILLFMLKK